MLPNQLINITYTSILDNNVIYEVGDIAISVYCGKPNLVTIELEGETLFIDMNYLEFFKPHLLQS